MTPASSAPAAKSTASPMDSISPLSHWVEVLSETLHAINSGAAMSALLSDIANAACSLLRLDMCSLLIADEHEERLMVAGFCGLSPEYVQLVNGSRPITLQEQEPSYSSPSAQAYLTRSLVLIPDASQASEFSPWRDMARDEGYESLIAAPLANKGTALGVLVGYGRKARRYTSEQIDGLELLARFASTTLITARLRSDSREMIEKLNRTNMELLSQQRLVAEQDFQHDELMRAVASNIGVSGVISTLARLLRVPVCLQDTFGTNVAEETLQCSPESLSLRDQYVQSHRDVVLANTDTSRYLPDISTTVRPIVLNAESVAVLLVGPTTAGHDPISEQLLDRFSLAVALELAKDLPLARARRSVARDVVSRLTTAQSPEQRQSAAQRAQELGFDLRETMQLALFEWVNQDEAPFSLVEFLEARALRAGHPVLIGSDGQRAVAAIQAPENLADAFLVESLDHLRGICPGHPIRSVVATSTPGLHEIDRLHRGLVGAISLLPVSGVWAVTRADLSGMTGLILTHGSPETLRNFAEEVLAPLLDASGRNDLYTTLGAWLDSNCSISTASEMLHVHPNTVKYRLKNIEKMLGKDLKSADDLIEIRLAMDIHTISMARSLSNATEMGGES